MSIPDNRITPTHHPWCGYWYKDYTPFSPIKGPFEVFFELIKSEIGQSTNYDVDPYSCTVAPSIVELDTADFDGVVKWEFEAIWCNRDLDDATLQVIDTDGNVYATITMSAGLSNFGDGILFRSRIEFTPGNGVVSYCLKYSRGSTDDGAGYEPAIVVSAARIIIIQEHATKTKIQIPLMGSPYNYIFDSGGFDYNGYSWGSGCPVMSHNEYTENWSYDSSPISHAERLSTIWKYDVGELDTVKKAKFIVDAQDIASTQNYSKVEHIGATSDIIYFDMMLYWAPAGTSDAACNNAIPSGWVSETQVHTDGCTGAVFTPIPGSYVHWDNAPYPYSFEIHPDFSGVPHDAKIFIGGDIQMYLPPPGPWGHFSKWFNNPATATKYVHDEKLTIESVDLTHMDWTFEYTLQDDYPHEENLFVALKDITTSEIVPNSELIWYADEFAYRQETEVTLTSGHEYKLVAKHPGIRPYGETNIYDAMLLLDIDPIKKLTTWYRCVLSYIELHDNLATPAAWKESDISTRIKLYNPSNAKAYFEITGGVDNYVAGNSSMMLERITETNDLAGSGIGDEETALLTWSEAEGGIPLRKRTGELSLSNESIYGNRQPAGESMYLIVSNGFIVLRIA